MDIVHNQTLNVSQDRLWTLLTELEELQKWSPSIISDTPISDGEPGPGFKTKMLIREGKSEVKYESELLEYTPQSRIVMQLRGGNLGKGPMTLTYDLTPDGDQTHLRYRSEWPPVGIMMKLMHPLIVKMSRRNVTEQMDSLRKVAEG